MDEIINGAVDQLTEAYSHAGLLGAACAAVVLGVNLYQLPAVQAFLPEKLQWAAWPIAGKLAFVFLTSAVVTALPAIVGGAAVAAAVKLGLSAGVGALLAHRYVLAPASRSETAHSLASKLPAAAARAMSIAVPIDMEKVEEMRATAKEQAALRKANENRDF